MPLLIQTATYQSGEVCFFLWSLFALKVQGPVCEPTAWIIGPRKRISWKFLMYFLMHQCQGALIFCHRLQTGSSGQTTLIGVLLFFLFI